MVVMGIIVCVGITISILTHIGIMGISIALIVIGTQCIMAPTGIDLFGRIDIMECLIMDMVMDMDMVTTMETTITIITTETIAAVD